MAQRTTTKDRFGRRLSECEATKARLQREIAEIDAEIRVLNSVIHDLTRTRAKPPPKGMPLDPS